MKQKESENSKKILVATDGSKISWNTATTSIEVAKAFDTEILGLYVIDEELVVNDYADYRDELGVKELLLSRTDKAALFKNRGHEILKNLKTRCRANNVWATTEIGLGGVEKTVLDQAQRAAILAIGRRGNGHPDTSDYLGRNFRRIAHQAKLPLLIGGESTNTIKKILLAYNGRERAQKALGWAKRFLDHGTFEMLVLIVKEEDSSSVRVWEKDIKSEFSQNGIKNFRLIIQQGNAAERIVENGVKNQSDLVIMGGYSHKALLEWLEGSTLESVLRKMPLPVLVA
jgi:nucleotide-binding universal stress UspA family protein